MAKRPPSVSVVVATYGRRDHLDRFLDALLANRALDEVIVAVDGSPDGSIDLVEQRASLDGRVRGLLVDHQGQFGALDAGVRKARGDVVLLLDDDVIVGPELVAGHARHHQREGLVVLGYMPPRLPPRPTTADFATVLYQAEYEGRCRHYEQVPGMVLHHLWGGNVSLHKRDYERLDPEPLTPPPTIPDVRLYHQDRDFGFRCLDVGLHGVFDRSLVAVHEHQRDAGGFLRDAFGQGASLVLLQDRHAPRFGTQSVASRARPAIDPSDRAHAASHHALTAAIASRSLRTATTTARVVRRVEQRRGARAMAHHLIRFAPTPAEETVP